MTRTPIWLTRNTRQKPFALSFLAENMRPDHEFVRDSSLNNCGDTANIDADGIERGGNKCHANITLLDVNEALRKALSRFYNIHS